MRLWRSAEERARRHLAAAVRLVGADAVAKDVVVAAFSGDGPCPFGCMETIERLRAEADDLSGELAIRRAEAQIARRDYSELVKTIGEALASRAAFRGGG